MTAVTQSQAKTSKLDWMVPASVAGFIVAYFGARILMKIPDLPRALYFAAALLPAPAFLWFLWSMARVQRHADELQRRIQLEALAIAWPLSLAIVMTVSLLQKAGFLGWEPMWVYLPSTYFIGLIWAVRRYQ